MKRRRSLFLHLNQIKILAKKFALVILFLIALLLMLLSKNQKNTVIDVTSTGTGVAVAVVDVLVFPAKIVSFVYDFFYEIGTIRKRNVELAEENKKLKLLKDKYEALKIENNLLADLLNFATLPDVQYISAKVVAEESDAFSQSVVAYVGKGNVKKGDVVLSDKGVVGRIDSVKMSYAKIITLADINSKIPVMVEKNRVRGILSGNNTPFPKLTFVPLDAEVMVGDKIITSGVSGVFPAGLPIGQVVSVSKNEIKVKPFALLEKLEYVKIVKYGIDGLIESADEVVNE